MGSDIRDMLPVLSAVDNTISSINADSLAGMAYDKAGDAARLKAIYERLVDGRGESRAEFGRRSGLGKPANIGHYLNGKNNLSIDAARKFAAFIPCKIEDFSPYWSRLAHASGQVALGEKGAPHIHGDAVLSPSERSGQTLHAASPIGNYSVSNLKLPLLPWSEVGLMLEHNEVLVGVDGVSFIDAEGENGGARTKFVHMPDDSMSPVIQAGDLLTLEPDWTPEPGEIVLVKESSGAHFIRRYKFIRQGHFMAEPANLTDYQPLDSGVFDLAVVAVVTARRQFIAKRRR
jgi:hypothetical protein